MTYYYKESGLRNVWLLNGYELVKTSQGESVVIYDLEGLHKVIGEALCSKKRLTGTEFRFLRKELELSQGGLGLLLGVSDQAIAKWEKTGKVPKTADRFIRLIYLEQVRGNVEIKNTIELINDTDRQDNEKIVAEESAGHWKVAA